MTAQSPEPRRLSRRKPLWIITTAIIAAVWLAYSNSFPGAFYFDDTDAIVLNESIRDLANWRAVLWPPVEAGIGGRPFANLTYALSHAMSGYEPWSYRAFSIAIHAFSAALLFGLVRRTLVQPVMHDRFGQHAVSKAAMVALFWGLHPVQTNVVDYMSQRTEGLMGMLYLLTVYAFVRSVDTHSRGWAVVAVASCFAGMASKEGMVTAPFMVLLYDRTFISGTFLEAVKRHWRTHSAVAASWMLLAGLMLTSKLGERGVGFGLGQTGFDYALTEIRAVVRYLQLSWWPHPLIFDYGPLYEHRIGAVWPSAVLLFSALVATALAVWRSPAVGFACAWFFVILAPSSSIIPVVQQPCAENRVYLPLAGVAALTAVLVFRALGRAAMPLLGAVAVALGIGTFLRNPDFQSEYAIWVDTVAKRPENHRAENNLGNALLKAGREDEALKHFETALRLMPTYADARNNRGVVLLNKRRPAEALADFKTAIKHKKDYADAHYNLGEAYLQLGNLSEAIAALEASLKINPKNPKAYNNLGIALLEAGKVQESIAAERRALELSPDLPEAYYNLGNSLARAGQPIDALEAYENALRRNPAFAKAHNNAGVILLRLGKLKEAGARFEAALRIDKNYGDARKNLELVKTTPTS